MTAAESLARIVSLVAELTRVEREAGAAPTVATLAASFGVTPAQIAADIRTLTQLNDHSDAEWLLSLSAWQQGEMVGVSSAGPFRRPVRLSPDELYAVQLALVMEGETALAARLGAVAAAGAPAPPSVRQRLPAYDLLSDAVASHLVIELLYAGEGEQTGRQWVIHPHQLAEYRDRTYVVAWCVASDDWRHFRLDRILDALPAGGTFAPRADFRPVLEPGDVFRAADDAVEQVAVRFSPAVARWVRERYRDDVEEEEDGAVRVRLPVTSVAWLVRRVLEYGDDAEVIGPAAYREAMRRAVA
jgi:predicted DNA-binding transcriptional regulator YafY